MYLLYINISSDYFHLPLNLIMPLLTDAFLLCMSINLALEDMDMVFMAIDVLLVL